MKSKILATIAILLMLVTSSGTMVSAANMEEPVGDVTVYYGTPTCDGVISEGEYDGARRLEMNHVNMQALQDVFTNSDVPKSLKITSYQLWDDTGLYLAFNIEDESIVRGYVDESNNWHFNADNIQIFLDPGPTLAGQMLMDAEARGGRRAPMYTIGVNEDGTVYLLRQLVENEMIANLSEEPWSCGGQGTDYGWTFELCIPWEMLITDVTEKVAEPALTKEDVKEGMKMPAMFIYNDMELIGDYHSQCGMYETCLNTNGGFDWQPEIFGINFILSETVQEEAPVYVEPSEETEETEELDDYRQVTVDTETDTDTSDTDTQVGESDIPWGWVIGIGAAVVIVAAAVIAYCVMKKDKAKK